jgi:uncharacterized surface protein with fasciclin (FAS1) repeats
MLDRRASLRLVLLGGGAAVLAGCASGGGGGGGQSSGTVLDVLRANRLDRFRRAIDAAGLTATPAGPGPYTLFAPSNRAFAAADLPQDTETLRAVVSYHIVPGMFSSDFLAGVDVNYTTLAGTSLNVDGTGGTLRVNGAAVLAPDLGASNGVVNIIDQVLDPR